MEQVTNTIRHLTASENSYKIYGYWICRKWKCKHELPVCSNEKACKNREENLSVDTDESEHEPNRCKCEHEWRTLYSKKTLKKYLNGTQREPPALRKNCKKHGKNTENSIFITSFLLYNSENSNETLIREIVCKLVWEGYYRVFGNWKCSNCYKKWRSAYTWISLQDFINKIPGKRLNRQDYCMQDCKTCKKSNKSCYGKITGYKPLVKSEEDLEYEKPHIRELCAKCQNGSICNRDRDGRYRN